MFLEASVAHMVTGDFDALIASAERARALSAGAEPAVELLATAVIGAGQVALGEVEPGVAALRRLRAVPDGGRPAGHRRDRRAWPPRRRSGSRTGTRAARILSRVLGAARAASAVSALIHPLAVHAHLDLRRGRWAPALAGASEAAELAEDTGQLALLPHALAALTLVEAGLGHEADCRRHVERGLELAGGEPTASTCTPRSACSSSASAGSPRRSRRSRPAERQMLRRGLGSTVVPLRARPGRGLRPRRPPRRGRGRARAADAARRATTGGGAALARARPRRAPRLLAPDDDVRAAFDAALALHDGLPMPFERARTQLALGERLRRAKQRAEAREPLTEALDAFERLGARPWAERARDGAARHRRPGERRAARRPRRSSSRRTSCRSPCSSARA